MVLIDPVLILYCTYFQVEWSKFKSKTVATILPLPFVKNLLKEVRPWGALWVALGLWLPALWH